MSSRSENIPQEATVLGETSQGNIIIDEHVLEQAKKAADTELAKRRHELEEQHEKQLDSIRSNLQKQLDETKSRLRTLEEGEKILRTAVEEAKKATKDVAHRELLQSIQREEEYNQRQHEETITRLRNEDKSQQSSWTRRNHEQVVSRLNEREQMQADFEHERALLVKMLEEEKDRLAQEHKRIELEWRLECEQLNDKYQRNLIWGVVFGGLVGFAYSRSKF